MIDKYNHIDWVLELRNLGNFGLYKYLMFIEELKQCEDYEE